VVQSADLSHEPGSGSIVTRRFEGLQDYSLIQGKMQQFVADRQAGAIDEIWLLQHRPVFTQGINGQPEHVLDAGDIPVVKSDRGGQITYHGPGQLVCYLMLDMQRRALGVKGLVQTLEQAVINVLLGFGLQAERRCGAPGIYIDEAKIASLGLRIRRGCSYHGVSLNVDMDLEPFGRINPCGYVGMAVTQLSEWMPVVSLSINEVGTRMVDELTRLLST